LNFIFGIVCLFVCVCAFSLRRESPDMILGDKPLIFEVVLLQWCSGGSEMARSVLLMVLCRGGTPANTEERGVAQHCSSAATAASGAEERVRARKQGKEEESDFTSSMGHNGEGIRVIRRLEAVGDARRRGKPRRRETKGDGGPVGAVAPSDAAMCVW
jgi:hypothetical protein